MRDTLPLRRPNYTYTMTFQGERYDVTIGEYPSDGRTGEVFINRILGKNSAKVGTLLDDICRDSAILVSLCLQHGVFPSTLRHAITRNEDGEPSTIVGAIIDQFPTTPSNESPPDADNPQLVTINDAINAAVEFLNTPLDDAPAIKYSTDLADAFTLVPSPRDVTPANSPPTTLRTPARCERCGQDVEYCDAAGVWHRSLCHRDGAGVRGQSDRPSSGTETGHEPVALDDGTPRD